MKQITFQKNKLTLTVGKSPLFLRIILFPFAFSFFLLPVYGVVASILNGNGIMFFSFIVIAVFFYLGFYLLKITLWNTFGKETIIIGLEKITYEADYGWFKGAKKEIPLGDLNCSIKSEREEDRGVLILESGKAQIECVAQVPLMELEKLLIFLRNTLPADDEKEFFN